MLTLTATPIPRTLNMAMSGMRDLSIIATPPAKRLAIKTFVSKWNNQLMKESCQRELNRGGQIYFVHNEVETIENQVNKLRELLPDASIEYAHGQMRERQLEQVMSDFYHQRFNILVCTTIIETGIDIRSHVSYGIIQLPVGSAGLILGMEEGHRESIIDNFPIAGGKTHLLGDFSPDNPGCEIEDPVGLPLECFRESFQEIKTCTDLFVEWLILSGKDR